MVNRNNAANLHNNAQTEKTPVPRENVVDLRSEVDTAPVRQAKGQGTKRNPSNTRRALPFAQTGKFFLSIAVVLLLVALPLVTRGLWYQAHSAKGRVLGEATGGYAQLQQAASAMQALDLQLAANSFSDAANSFRSAHAALGGLGAAFTAINDVLTVAPSIRSGAALIDGGEQLALAGGTMTEIVMPLLHPADGQKSAADIIGSANQSLDAVRVALEKATDDFAKVRLKDIPQEQRASFQSVLSALPQLNTLVAESKDIVGVVSGVLGQGGTRRYVVVFQNNLEVRPTGGFIGSMAVVDIANGHVTKLTVPSGGTYDYKGQLTEHLLSPEPLHLVNPDWQMQDANWWPDFPTSAQKLMWFYEKSGGPSTDGVITITPDVVTDLLKITGPIDLQQQYGITVDAQNFVHDVLMQIQEKRDAANANPDVTTNDKPKQIIADLVPVMLDKVLTVATADPITILKVFESHIKQKNILLYSPEKEIQSQLRQLGWAGAIRVSASDYISVIDTNIGGGKTDGVIDETVEHTATIRQNGSIVDTVTITRVHLGDPDDPITGSVNKDYIRLYVPQGSTIIDAQGFNQPDAKDFLEPASTAVVDTTLEQVSGHPITDTVTGMTTGNEFGKTVFSNWMIVKPGETAKATIAYQLPFRITFPFWPWQSGNQTYSLLAQKQSGAKTRYFSHTLQFPDSLVPRSIEPQNVVTQNSSTSLGMALPLVTDQLYGVVFKKNNR